MKKRIVLSVKFREDNTGSHNHNIYKHMFFVSKDGEPETNNEWRVREQAISELHKVVGELFEIGYNIHWVNNEGTRFLMDHPEGDVV